MQGSLVKRSVAKQATTESFLDQAVDHLLPVLGVAHFKYHVDIGLFCRDVIEMTLVIDFNDVSVFFADQGTDGG